MANRQRDARNDADDRANGLAYDLRTAEHKRDEFAKEALRVSEICRQRDQDIAEQRQRADVLQSQLGKLKADMADPSQPERASDLVQLVRERDTARTALAASQARCERQDAAIATLAAEFERLCSRVAIAEAAVRRAA